MNRIHLRILLSVTLAFLVAGLLIKSTYSDFNTLEKPLESFMVAQLSDALLDNQISLLMDELDNSNYILTVECLERSQFRYACTSQSVEIIHVYKGDDLEVGDIISIGKYGSLVNLQCMDEYDGYMLINMGFVNEMTIGNHYLIFLERKIDTEEPIYLQSDQFILAPIFNYKDIQNAVGEYVNSYSSYVKYTDVSENEFFISDPDMNAELNFLKDYFIKKYPDIS